MDSPPLASAEAAATVITPPGKPEKATTKAARPTTLLDVQEVEWITRELERLLAQEREQSGGDADAVGRQHRRKRARLSAAAPAAAHNKGGFLANLLGRHAVSFCSGDAVAHSSAAGDRGRPRGGRRGFREVEKV